MPSMKDKELPSASSELRCLAEERLYSEEITARPSLLDDESLRLSQELQVHQIELEMQNEELRRVIDDRGKLELLLGNYSDLYDFAPVGYFNLDHSGIIHAVNLTGARFLGVARSLLISRRLDLFISDETRSVFHDSLDKVFASETKVTCEVVFLQEGHAPLFVQIEAVISESREACCAVVIDITARKRAEEALRVSEAEKALILNSTIDLVVYHDTDMRVLWGNRKALDSVGMHQEDLVGRHCWEIWHQRCEPCEGCPVILARDTGKPQEGEIRSPDGREWFIRGFPVKDDDGRVKGVVEFCLEITAHKQAEYALLESERLLESEKRFRSLFEHMLEGVAYCRMVYDEDGCPVDFVYLDVNSAYSKLTGLHNVVGRKVSELLPGIKESAPWLFEVYGRVASTGHPEKCELFIEQLSLWRSMSVYSTEKGYFVAVSENITERKRIEAELKESHHKLCELTAHLNLTRELERKAFARKVHDDLGTSLTLLKFDLAWIKRNHPTEDKAVIERIKTMDELIHECTKTIQRITSELRPALLDEQGLAATIQWKAKEFERRSGISCTLEIDPSIPSLSQDMAINVFRIFQQSLSNIMQHAGATSVALSLTKAGKRIVLRITDNGVGIRDQKISAPTSFGIMGMKEHARLCEGDITIKGIQGKGTTISVSIPIDAWGANNAKHTDS